MPFQLMHLHKQAILTHSVCMREQVCNRMFVNYNFACVGVRHGCCHVYRVCCDRHRENDRVSECAYECECEWVIVSVCLYVV